MKYIILLLICNICIENLQAETIAFTEAKSNYMKETCSKRVKTYNSYLNNLMSPLSGEDKNAMTFAAQEELFRNSDTRIESDISTMTQQDYKVAEYLDNIAMLYGKLDNVKIDFTKTTISDIYYNDIERYYFIIASVEREIIVAKNDKDNKQKVDKNHIDIYFNFDASGKLKLKIFSIQNHKEEVLKNRKPVPIISEDEAEKSLAKNIPYFIFEIKPSTSEVIIDGKNIAYFYGEKVATTPGRHTIEITAPRYKSIKFDVTVSETGLQKIKRDLVRKEGYLSIRSLDQDRGAYVYIDDAEVGVVPIQHYSLPVGFHTIIVKKKGFFKYKRTVRISEENPTTLNVKLNSNKHVKNAAVVGGLIIIGTILSK